MAESDNQMIDRALDQAQEMIQEQASEKEVIQESTPSPGKESPVEDVQETVEAKKAIEKQTKTRDRDESGKFTKKTAAEEKTDLNDQEAQAIEETTEVQEETSQGDEVVDSLAFWSPEEKGELAKASPQLKKIIADKETQRNQYSYRLEQEANRGRTIAKDLEEVLTPHLTRLTAHGVEKRPMEAVKRLLAWNEIIENDPDKAILGLMRQHGRTPYDYLNGNFEGQGNSQPEADQSIVDPRVDELNQKIENLTKQAEDQQKAAFVQSINQWKEGKDSFGNIRKQYAEMFAPQIEQLVTRIQNEYPQVPFQEALDKAYEFVVKENRNMFGVQVQSTKPAPKAPEAKVADAKKAKVAMSAVTGSPASGNGLSRPRVTNIDEAIDKAFAIHGVS